MRSGHKQHHRLAPAHLGQTRPQTRIRRRHRRHREQPLPGDRQRFPAGGQHPQRGAFPQQGVGQDRAGRDQVLAVVQDQQAHDDDTPLSSIEIESESTMSVGELLGQPLQWRPTPLRPQPQRRRHQIRQHVGVLHLLAEQPRPVQLGQIDEPHPIAERPPHVGPDPQREPGLARPAHPGHHHQPRLGQQPLDLGQLPTTPDETERLVGKVPDPARAHTWHVARRYAERPYPAIAWSVTFGVRRPTAQGHHPRLRVWRRQDQASPTRHTHDAPTWNCGLELERRPVRRQPARLLAVWQHGPVDFVA